ncbi:MAG TPA: hypothetical protein VFQ06_11305 [Nitrospira sp.]|nr:hypothetical protein [Nitrospira sp.]
MKKWVTGALLLALLCLFAATASAAEITGSRVQSESQNPTNTTTIYQPSAEPDNGSTDNALRHNANLTVNYSVTVPSGASATAIKVKSRCANTCSGSAVGLNVVVNGTAQTAQNVAASAQTFTERTWTLGTALSPGTHTIGVKTTNTTTNNRVINDFLYLDGTNAPPPDTTDPDTSITSGPAGGSTDTDGNVTFTYSGTDNVAVTGFDCSMVVSGQPNNYSDCGSMSTKSYNGLAEGAWNFKVRAKDAAGNVDASAASRTFNVDLPDTTPPTTTLTSTDLTTTNNNTPIFTFTGSDDVGVTGFECRVDAGSFAACTSPHTTATLADGSRTFEVRAKDAANNVDGTPASDTFTVDTAPPAAPSISAPASDGTTDTDGNLSFTFSGEGGASFECDLDVTGSVSDSFTSCTSPKTYTGQANGAYTFRVRQIDAAGNTSANATRTLTVAIPGDLPDHAAVTADEFVHSMGIDTQLKDQQSIYGDFTTDIKPALDVLGIKHARDSAVLTGNTTIYGRYSTLCTDLGIKYLLNVNDELWQSNGAPTSSQFNTIVSQAGCAAEMFEGPNEYNNGRIGDGVWDEELEDWQCDIFNNLNNSNNPNIPVLSAPLGKGDNNIPPPEEMPELGACSDLNGMHSYPAGSMPTGSHRQEYDSTLDELHLPQAIEVGDEGVDVYPSETGYTTAANHVNRVSELARTKYIPRLYLEYFNRPYTVNSQTSIIQRVYLFQLADHDPPDPDVATTKYGLLDYQGNWTDAGKTVENFVDVVDEPAGSAYSAGTLEFDISGDSAALHTELLQKRDGDYYLAMWKEVESYDRDTDTDLSPSSDSLTIDFESSHDFDVYRPRNLTGWTTTHDAEANPESSPTSGSTVSLSVGDEVKILKIEAP